MTCLQFYPTNSYLKEDAIVSAEFNLYNTKDEKLLWSGETDAVYSKDFGKLGKEHTSVLVRQLKKDKVIQEKMTKCRAKTRGIRELSVFRDTFT